MSDPHAHAPSSPSSPGVPGADDGDDLPVHGTLPAEPRSPVWLPIVGVALLSTALVWWLSTPNDAEQVRLDAEAAASASASAAASAAASASASNGADNKPKPPAPAITVAPTAKH